jgi:hypothetical protein
MIIVSLQSPNLAWPISTAVMVMVLPILFIVFITAIHDLDLGVVSCEAQYFHVSPTGSNTTLALMCADGFDAGLES